MKIEDPHQIPRARLSRLALKIVLISLFALCSVQIFAQKMLLRPADSTPLPRIHPHTRLLRQSKPGQKPLASKGDYEKLLVILVDFAEEIEDDPLSTGNGKFELEPDPDYLYSIGAPPHDREYFEANLEAMRYYYLAASVGSYDLEYDVWPKDKPAYTLPEKMSYYNPPEASSGEFVSKMEEYFKLAFETADQEDPEIDFSSYAHYMIIHAGSDWQHDIFGDSPSDIPSFFIRVGDGKQAVVDGGQTEIYHACNVPATISQDFQTTEDGGDTIHTGYGALNSVLFHEFGHSLGLVDLYNVRNFYPMVGMFDIMDSGGSGVMLDELPGGDLVYVQGVLPSLPGAFSRALLFEDDFRARGLMTDVTDLQPNTTIELAASSMMQSGVLNPNIIRFPIAPDEYFLIENRSVDPDGDGGTAVFSTLDQRVVLYPTALGSDQNDPSYEYDYLLPSFLKADNSAVGGGILVWHVDEKLIFDEGTVLSDGTFWSNFENNSVNTNFNRPGVSVLEADGLRDLGEVYSSYWTGTPYEYFHARKPLLDGNGSFVNWSLEPWRPTLSAHTKPAMTAWNGLGGVFFMDEISDPAAVMNFTLKAGIFDELYSEQSPQYMWPAVPINTNYSDLSLPFYGAGEMRLLTESDGDWLDLMGPSALPELAFDYPMISVDSNQDGYMELVAVKGSKLYFLDYANISLTSHLISFSEDLAAPLALGENVYVHTAEEIYRIQDFDIAAIADISSIKTIAALDEYVLALREREFLLLDPLDLSIKDTLSLPEAFGDYEPMLVPYGEWFYIYLMSDAGNLYRYYEGGLREIFTNETGFLPSQIGGYVMDDSGVNIFFGLGDMAYLLGYNGYIKKGFPRYLDQIIIEHHAHPKGMIFQDEQILCLPVEGQGYLALKTNGEPRPEYSLTYTSEAQSGHSAQSDYLYFNEDTSQLWWYYTQNYASGSRIYIHSVSADEDPILWNGYRNGLSGAVKIPDDLGNSMPSPGPVNAYVFPNPVKSGLFRLRIIGGWPPTQVSIYDVAGKRIYSKTWNTDCRIEDLVLDSARFSSGVYIVHIKTDCASKTVRFAVEK